MPDVQGGLIGRIDALTAVRPLDMKATAFVRAREMLVERLAYLDDASLAALAGQVELMALEAKRWPQPVAILRLADEIFPNPAYEKARAEGIARWMRCSKGRDALAGGYAVEMLAWLRAGPLNRPVMRMTIDAWKTRAERRQFEARRALENGDADVVALHNQREREASALVMSAAPAMDAKGDGA